jgi:glycerol-3-phosphate dehydrogenase
LPGKSRAGADGHQRRGHRPRSAQSIAQRLRGDTLRAYVSDDLTGTAGGAVKNVLAIAAGASDGLGFGNNARAALITRGWPPGLRPPGRRRR